MSDDDRSISFEEVLKLIPHRYPFLLVDRGEEYEASTRMVGIKNVTFNEPFFQGHFPDNPVMPGVLIIEAMGQSGAVMMSKSLNVDVARNTVFFMSVDGVRFRHPVRPGDTLRMPVVVTKYRGGYFKFQGQTYVGDKLVAEAAFSAMLVEKPQ